MKKHNCFWDCIEDSTIKRSKVRLTPKVMCDKVEIYTCEICKRKHVNEIFFYENSKEISETNRYSLKNGGKKLSFDEILEDYV